MAYSMYEETNVKNLKQVQYYPEESDTADHSDVSEPKYYYSPRRLKKLNRIIPEVNYMNERKCPIYVHEYKKIPSDSTYDNHSSKSLGKTTLIKSKSSNSPSSRSVLDKLEETYWAKWKPSKDKYARSPRRYRSTSENKAYGDTSETLVKFFEKSNFKVSSASVDDSNFKYDDRPSRSTRLIEMSTREIQTEDLPPLVERESDGVEDEAVEKNDDDSKPNTYGTQEDVKERIESRNEIENGDGNDNVPVKDIHIEEEETIADLSPKSKLLEHKDSLIIHKKKQEEVKETFQQPKCIKLYKKPGSSYLRGGTYPLKSCLRNDSTPKGHFRLGPPGSPMFVTSSSFNRKYGK